MFRKSRHHCGQGRRGFIAFGGFVLAMTNLATADTTFTKVITRSGDGGGAELRDPNGLAVDASGNLFVSGFASENVFRIGPDGQIVEIMDSAGNGFGDRMDEPHALATDPSGTLHVAGRLNLFRVSPSTGFPSALSDMLARRITADADRTTYLVSAIGDGVIRVRTGIAPDLVIGPDGDNQGRGLVGPSDVATDALGNVYVCGADSNNVLKFNPLDETITEIVNLEGDGTSLLSSPRRLAVGPGRVVYVLADSVDNGGSANVFEIRQSRGGQLLIREVLSNLQDPQDIAVDPEGNVYVSDGRTVFRNSLQTFGEDFLPNVPFRRTGELAVDPAGFLYVADPLGDQVFKVVIKDCNTNGIPDPSEIDSDGDGTIDDCDNCPTDPDKTDPGACGCGNPERDSDRDGIPDCIDNCPTDPDKTDPGACGCGVADADTDGDGTPDCLDSCPEDPDKNAPGDCGCGVSDTDTDGDGTSDCLDSCPDNPNKIEPGACGCDAVDTDTDGNGVPDCSEPTDDTNLEPSDPPAPDPTTLTQPVGACGVGTANAIGIVAPMATLGWRSRRRRRKPDSELN